MLFAVRMNSSPAMLGLIARAGLMIPLLLTAPASTGFSAQAQSRIDSFRTPSDNIHCMVEHGGTASGADWLRCDIMEITSGMPAAPDDCELAWGHAFSVGQASESGFRLCHGDTTYDPAAPVLHYGSKWQAGEFICSSEATGLECRNEFGRGFFLSKRMQKLF